ncbi:MAG: HigA family addiction module antidote protein [SAR324 cluster bacterium]|nr:HigA family addiction module antidote protein [SAR324 cluster bacterium]
MDKAMIEVEAPGIILKEEFMEPYGITSYRLVNETGIDKMTLSGILRGTRKITPVSGLKLSKFFGLSERFWTNLQTDYDIRVAKLKIAQELENIHTLTDVLSA